MENKVTREQALVADLMLGTTLALPREIIFSTTTLRCLELVCCLVSEHSAHANAKCVVDVQFDSLSDVAKVSLFRKLIKLINSNG